MRWLDHVMVLATGVISEVRDTGGATTIMAQVTADILVNKSVFAEYVSERRPERLLRTLSIFVTELDGKVSALSDVKAKRDVEGLRAVTHSMLGSSVMLGVKRMVDLSSMLEQEPGVAGYRLGTSG